jgi:hypothetical protein
MRLWEFPKSVNLLLNDIKIVCTMEKRQLKIIHSIKGWFGITKNSFTWVNFQMVKNTVKVLKLNFKMDKHVFGRESLFLAIKMDILRLKRANIVIMADLKMGNSMAKAIWSQLLHSIKDSSQMEWRKDQVSKNLQTKVSIEENISIINMMGKDSLKLLTIITKGFSKKESRTVLDFNGPSNFNIWEIS